MRRGLHVTGIKKTPRNMRGVLFWLRSVADALGGDDAPPVRTTAHDLAHGAVRAAAKDTASHVGLRYTRMRDGGEAGRGHSDWRGGCRSRESGEAEDTCGGKSESCFLHYLISLGVQVDWFMMILLTDR